MWCFVTQYGPCGPKHVVDKRRRSCVNCVFNYFNLWQRTQCDVYLKQKDCWYSGNSWKRAFCDCTVVPKNRRGHVVGFSWCSKRWVAWEKVIFFFFQMKICKNVCKVFQNTLWVALKASVLHHVNFFDSHVWTYKLSQEFPCRRVSLCDRLQRVFKKLASSSLDNVGWQ
jgi:hypothetical protein